jgi:hypothetical protein
MLIYRASIVSISQDVKHTNESAIPPSANQISDRPTNMDSVIASLRACCLKAMRRPFRFLDLPAEVRIMVYEHFIPNLLTRFDFALQRD